MDWDEKIILLLSILLVVALLVYLIAYCMNVRPANPTEYVPMNREKIYHAPFEWKGVPIDAKKRYVNYEYPFYQNYVDVVNWFPGNLANMIRNFNYRFRIIHISDNSFLFDEDKCIWLGHASFFMRLNGINILIDPQFYSASFYKRHSKNPVEPELFTNIKYILISHDHEDHCDKRSLQLLLKNNPSVIILTGLGMGNLLRSFFSTTIEVKEAAWYEQFALSETGFSVHFVPSRHYCMRPFKIFNKNLWGGFVIKYPNSEKKDTTIYFAGDSGYGSHFKDIGSVFHPTIAILGIGAYKPHKFMHPNHISPVFSIKAFYDTGALTMIPMHYGTFLLSNENPWEPLEILRANIDDDKLVIKKPGEYIPL